MKLKRLQIRNFQSLGEVDFNFPAGLVLIDGWNEDLGCHNGVGKSALLNSITYAIYGKTPKDIALGELVRHGADSMSVEIELESKGRQIFLKRSRTEKSGKVELKIDGEVVPGLMKDLEARIPDLIGLTFDQFVQVVYVFQGSDRRFINLNDTEKKEFLSALLNLNVYDNAYKISHARLTALELDHSKLMGTVESSEKNLSTLVQNLDGARERISTFNEEKKAKVAELSNRVRATKAAIKELELLKMQTSQSTRLKELIAQKGEMQRLIDANQANKEVRDGFVSVRAQRLKEIEKLQKKLEFLADEKCPTCKQSLPVWSIDQTRRDYQREIDSVLGVTPTPEEIERVSSEIVPDSKLNALTMKVLGDIAAEQARGPEQYDPLIAAKQSELHSLASEVESLDGRAESLQREVDRANRMLEVARGELDATKAKIKELDHSRKYILEIKKIFSPTGVRAFVFDGIIRELNDKISKYLDSLFGGSLKFSFESDDSKGRFIEACEYGGVTRSVSALSGGEFRRLSLAVDLALSEVVCGRMSIFPDVLFLDEAFEGLDVVGREIVMNLLSELTQQKSAIYIVDHATEFKSAFSNTFELVKRNGTTTVTA